MNVEKRGFPSAVFSLVTAGCHQCRRDRACRGADITTSRISAPLEFLDGSDEYCTLRTTTFKNKVVLHVRSLLKTPGRQ